jgi:hypothetical protein
MGGHCLEHDRGKYAAFSDNKRLTPPSSLVRHHCYMGRTSAMTMPAVSTSFDYEAADIGVSLLSIVAIILLLNLPFLSSFEHGVYDRNQL